MCSVVEQFMNEGRTSEQKRIAENMVNQGFNDEQILAVTGITRECLDAIKSADQKLN